MHLRVCACSRSSRTSSRLSSRSRLRLRRTFALALALSAAGCVSPDGPFTRVGTPAKPLYEARPHCKEEVRSSEGTIDWVAYEECMAKLGWVKQTPQQGVGPGPTGGGGGPSY